MGCFLFSNVNKITTFSYPAKNSEDQETLLIYNYAWTKRPTAIWVIAQPENEVQLDSTSLFGLHKTEKRAKFSVTSVDTRAAPSPASVIPQVLRSVHKAGQSYPAWKAANSPDHKPWLYPIQSELPMMDAAELSIQRGDSLENVDESSSRDVQENEDSS